MATPILDLATLTDRPTVAIDGVAYRLRATDDFSIYEFQQHAQQLPRFAELMNVTATEEEGAELKLLLDAYCRRVLEAPTDVHAKLSDGQRLRIVTVFAQLLGMGGLLAGATTRRPQTTGSTTTGESSSPASPGSTEGIH